MKIAIIGPGYMDIPCIGWGAVESIIWALASRTRQLGHEVDIINSTDLQSVIKQINDTDYQFVHCEFDDYVGILSQHCNKPIYATTHYAGITQWKTYNPGYGPIHQGVLNASGGIIALSEQIAEVYKRDGFSKTIYTLRNGTEVGRISFSKTPSIRKAICVGKIEPRKRQAKLAELCKGKVELEFVGPLHDPTFKENSTCRYLGEWTREQLYENLTNYSCLVLASDAEASPLVTVEGIAAGLPLAITDVCDANLKDFYGKYLDWNRAETIPDTINQTIEMGQDESIRLYQRNTAEQCFDWDIIVREYLAIIEEIVNITGRKNG